MKSKKNKQQTILFSSGKAIYAWQYQIADAVAPQKKKSVEMEENPMDLPAQSLGVQLDELLKPMNGGNKDVCLVLGGENVFCFRLEVPDLEKDDVNSFIELEAEQHLPYAPSEFYITLATQEKKVVGETLVLAIQKPKIRPFSTALKSIGYNLTSVTIDVAGNIPTEANEVSNESLLLQNGDHYTFSMRGCGKLLGIRQFPNPKSEIEIKSMIRDIRITIAQTATDIQEALSKIQYLQLPNASTEHEEMVMDAFQKETGLSITKSNNPEKLFSSIAETVSKRQLSQIEFLPPKPNRFEKIIHRFNSRRTFWIGASSTAAFIIIGLSFYIQNQQLNNFESKWANIKSKVEELEKVQAQIREFRPWYKKDIPTLQALKAMFETFPETGDIWLKQLTIKNGTAIRCGGSALNRNAVLAVREKLMATPGISDLRELASGGGRPMTFSFQFIWNQQAAAAGMVIASQEQPKDGTNESDKNAN